VHGKSKPGPQAAKEPILTQVMFSHVFESSWSSHVDAQMGAPATSLPRTSATTGNNVGVSHLTSAGNTKQCKTRTKESGGLSDEDEDDSIERESILKSPPKGQKRLTSVVSHMQYI
jgi:hypothetical protein